MKPLCIYHDKCADGFTSAWGVYKALGEEVEFFGGVHQNPPRPARCKSLLHSRLPH